MKIAEKSYGFVPVLRKGGKDSFLLVRHADSHWGFPKGHPEGDETPLATALRELAEECGIDDIKVSEGPVFSESYEFMLDEVTVVEKTNTFFLGFLKGTQVTPQAGEIAECRFVTLAESVALPLYKDTRRILTEASALLPRIPLP